MKLIMDNKEAVEYLGKIPIPRLMSNSLEDCIEQDKYYYAIRMGIEALENQKTGHWIEQDGYDGDTYYDCSECGESFCLIEGTPTDNLYKYCPNCGAKMEGDKE